MADLASAYLGGVGTGEGISKNFSDQFWNAMTYSDKLAQRQLMLKKAQQDYDLKKKGVDAAVSRADSEKEQADTKKASLGSEESVRKAQIAADQARADLDTTIKNSIAAGKGRNGTGPTTNKIPADINEANINLRSSRSALAAWRIQHPGAPDSEIPQELQDRYHSDLANVDRLGTRELGLTAPAAPAPAPVQHPAEGWLTKIAQGAGTAFSSLMSRPAAAPGAQNAPRVFVNPKTGERQTEPYYGAWGNQ